MHVTQTTQYIQHPSTLKAEIWCVPPDGQNLHSQKFQSNRTISSRDMAKYVGKIIKKEREGKSPQNDQKNQGKLAITQKLLVQMS